MPRNKKLYCRGRKTTFTYTFSTQALVQEDQILNIATSPISDTMGMPQNSTIQRRGYRNPALSLSKIGTAIRTPIREPHLALCKRSLVSSMSQRCITGRRTIGPGGPCPVSRRTTTSYQEKSGIEKQKCKTGTGPKRNEKTIGAESKVSGTDRGKIESRKKECEEQLGLEKNMDMSRN